VKDPAAMTTKPPPLPAAPPVAAIDPRLNAYRPDLAAKELQGIVEAPKYVAGKPAQVTWPIVPMRRMPVAASSLDTELLFGEAVAVYEEAEGWAWVQSERDRYVGYVPAAALQDRLTAHTHLVAALGTFIYPVADIKAPPLMMVSLGSLLTVVERLERFSRLAGGGFVINRHINEASRPARDFVEIAERFVGTPYLWGGRSRIGVDCSALVQLSMQAVGGRVPRDSDMQERNLGHPINITPSFDGLERGDLIFWKGHVGIMVDGVIMVHANAHHMAVVIEPLHEAAARISKTGNTITSIKRTAILARTQTS
jgi:cell wall-associated NlpC family hydrolase